MGYADDIKLCCPSLNGMQKMVDMCVDYADEYNIKFNCRHSCILLFKGRQCKDSKRMLIIDGVIIHCSESVSDLGHNVSTNDKDSIAKSAKVSFWRSFNLFRSDLGYIYSFIKCKLCQQYCCSFYGAPLWSLNSEATEDICIAWRKALRMLCSLHSMTHCDILAGLSNLKLLDVQLKYRFICFLKKCLNHNNATVKNSALIALNNPMSCAGNNYRQILSKYQNVLNNPTCVYDHLYSMCDDNMCIITVLRNMIHVRDDFKTCAYYTNNDIEDVINDICLN